MSHLTIRRLSLCLVLALVASPLLTGAVPPPTTIQLTGKVMKLVEYVEKQLAKLDADAAAVSLILVTDDGKVYPLLKDAASRMYFTDKALLNRPMQMTGRLLPGSTLFQLLEAQSLKDGKLHEIYYWCDVCSIRRGEMGACECCGGPMKLREIPVKK